MISKKDIARINELAKKKKAEGLTPDEQIEQTKLRKAYIQSIRSNLKAQLDNIEFVDPKPESEYTEEEKQHVAELGDKLKQKLESRNKSITELGNPAKPQGTAGMQMIQRMNESHAGLTAWALDYMRFNDDDKILDVGCGGGAAIRRMAGMIDGGHLTGIDYSPVSVKASTALNTEEIEKGRVDILEASVSDLPFDDDSFDKIVTIESYYFWPELESDMKEIFRVLKPGGQFILAAEIYQHDGLDAEAIKNIKKYGLRNLSIAEFESLFVDTGYRESAVHLKEGTDWICVEGIK